MWLKKVAEVALKVVACASGFMPILQGTVAGTSAANTVQQVTDDLTKIQGCIVTVETVFQALGAQKAGADKLKAAVPLVAQVVQQSELMIGKKVHDEAAFIKAVEGIASNMADLLNSLEAK